MPSVQQAEPFLRGYAATVEDVDVDKKWVVAKINTDDVDRFQTVVSPTGMDRSDYEKNKIVLWEHGKDPVRGRVPIGRNAWLKTDRAGGRDVLRAKTIFADDEFSRGLFELYRDDVLRGWSVYGTPVKASKPTSEEISRRAELARCKVIYRSWKLLEYSGVAIPGNLDTVTEACSRGLWVPDALRSLVQVQPLEHSGEEVIEPSAGSASDNISGGLLPPLVGRSLSEVVRSLEQQARAVAVPMLKQAMQDARDIARGKV